jgi:hypothetical protein
MPKKKRKKQLGSSRKKNVFKRNKLKSVARVKMKDETKNGIIIVCIFAFAALLFLSFFNIAGTVGLALDYTMALIFGWDRFLIPVLFVILGSSALFPERSKLGVWNYIGILFFFISFNALLNLFLIKMKEMPVDENILMETGGYIGQFLGTILPEFMGNWAAIVVLVSLFVVSVLLVFNMSLRDMFVLHTHMTGKLGSRIHRWRLNRSSSDYNNDGHDDPEEYGSDFYDAEPDDVEVENMSEKDVMKNFRKTSLKPVISKENNDMAIDGGALTTKKNRKIELSLQLLEYRGSLPNSGDVDRNKTVIRKTFENFGI